MICGRPSKEPIKSAFNAIPCRSLPLAERKPFVRHPPQAWRSIGGTPFVPTLSARHEAQGGSKKRRVLHAAAPEPRAATRSTPAVSESSGLCRFLRCGHGEHGEEPPFDATEHRRPFLYLSCPCTANHVLRALRAQMSTHTLRACLGALRISCCFGGLDHAAKKIKGMGHVSSQGVQSSKTLMDFCRAPSPDRAAERSASASVGSLSRMLTISAAFRRRVFRARLGLDAGQGQGDRPMCRLRAAALPGRST